MLKRRNKMTIEYIPEYSHILGSVKAGLALSAIVAICNEQGLYSVAITDEALCTLTALSIHELRTVKTIFRNSHLIDVTIEGKPLCTHYEPTFIRDYNDVINLPPV
jgi:hypothetical protein